jgi:hypothetical protein
VPYLDAAKWGLLAVTLIRIGVMLWARIDDSSDENVRGTPDENVLPDSDENVLVY